jgi:5'-3' exonuclease
MKKCICEEMNYDYELVQQAIYDYIFLGFLLGNDFIPSLPSVNFLNMNKSLNGLEILMFCYSKIYEETKEPLVKYVNNRVIINQTFLLELFKNLADSEEEYFKKSSYKKIYMNCSSNKPYDIEIFRLENLMFQINDPIQLGKINLNESKKRYYKYFKINDDVYLKGIFKVEKITQDIILSNVEEIICIIVASLEESDITINQIMTNKEVCRQLLKTKLFNFQILSKQNGPPSPLFFKMFQTCGKYQGS